MKKLIFLSVILLLFSFANAQKKSTNDFRLGVGAIKIGSGELIGGTFYNSYNYYLHKNFAVEPNFNFSYAENGATRTATYISTDANLYFIPLPYYPIARFKFGFGASVCYLHNSAGASIQKELTYGSLFVFAYDIPLNKHSVIGIKLTQNRYNNKDINTALSFNAGLKF